MGDYDVIVLGTGAAGLTAAVTAAELGAKVGLFEKGATLGGTTVYSGVGPEMVRWLDERTPVKFRAVPDFPDPPEQPGIPGRSVTQTSSPPTPSGARPSPVLPAPLTIVRRRWASGPLPTPPHNEAAPPPRPPPPPPPVR